MVLCCRSCFWALSCSWLWTVPGASWMGSGWPLVRQPSCFLFLSSLLSLRTSCFLKLFQIWLKSRFNWKFLTESNFGYTLCCISIISKATQQQPFLHKIIGKIFCFSVKAGLSLQQRKLPPPLSLSSCRPVVLDVVFQWHALVEESGGGTVNRGAGLQSLHAAHVSALCWSFSCHLHLPPLLWSGWVLSV